MRVLYLPLLSAPPTCTQEQQQPSQHTSRTPGALCMCVPHIRVDIHCTNLRLVSYKEVERACNNNLIQAAGGRGRGVSHTIRGRGVSHTIRGRGA